MRFLLSLVLLVATVVPMQAKGKKTNDGAHLQFEQTEYDFGEIDRKGENRVCVFKFVNDGNEPLVIFSAMTSCSCLKAEFSRKPVAVGESGEIRLHLESKKVEKGLFRRVVQIRSTSTGGTEILTLKGVSKD